LRILLLTPVFPPARGGIEVLGGSLAEHLADRVLVVTLQPGPGAEACPFHVTRAATRVLRLHNEPRGGRRSVLLLNAVALAAGPPFRPDVVVSLHVRATPAAHAVARLARAPLVQWIHAKEVREAPALTGFAVQRASAVVGSSAYSAELALEAGADPARTSILAPGVDVPATRRAQRAAEPTFVTVSRLEDRYKGHDVVLRALPAIRAAVPGARWVVIGEGSLRAELEREARRAGLEDAVEFLGSVDDPTRDAWLDRAWALVQPSRRPPDAGVGEGYGIVFVEAAAHGLPVVAGRVPGVVDAVRDGVTGLLVTPTDPAAVAAAVVRLLTDRSAAERMGDAGRAHAEDLTWPRVAARFRALLESQVAAEPPHRPHARTGWAWARELVAGPARPPG
jgi:phosphatidyl-myo-inositol dimannoside synthase